MPPNASSARSEKSAPPETVSDPLLTPATPPTPTTSPTPATPLTPGTPPAAETHSGERSRASTAGAKLLPLLPAAGAVLALDLATKWVATATLAPPGRSVSLLGDFVRLTLVHNSGGAFGLFPGRGPAFVVFSIAAIGLIVLLASRLPGRSRRELLALGALLGGALGNLFDRLRTGWVIDFIDVGLGHLRWPVFNVADIAVTLGVIVLLLGVVRRPG